MPVVEKAFSNKWCVLATLLQHTATHCVTMWHTATHCNTLQHTAQHCNTQQHTATHCNTLQHTATHCNTIQLVVLRPVVTQQHIATHIVTTTHCNALQLAVSRPVVAQQHTATHSKFVSNTLQHTSTLYNLQFRALSSHNNTLQHTATHYNLLFRTMSSLCSKGKRFFGLSCIQRVVSFRICVLQWGSSGSLLHTVRTLLHAKRKNEFCQISFAHQRSFNTWQVQQTAQEWETEWKSARKHLCAS